MDSDYNVCVVDDDPTSRRIMHSMLSDRYAVELFDSAETCLAGLSGRTPNLFLLDVSLPGLDGYELCRRLKSMPEGAASTVIFLTELDDLDHILAGYDAGAEDYIFKPFDVVGLYHKIENLRRIEQDRKSLLGQAQASDELASLVMANLDEYAILIKFLRTLNECTDYQGVVEALHRVMAAYHLEGSIQIRMRNVEKTFSKEGENWPLEIAVINHVRTLDRIFEFKTRAAFNFDHITILIANMPIGDQELCGRIRDNVAIVAESADAKLAALQSLADKTRLREDIQHLLAALGETVESYNRRYDDARYKGSVHTTQFLDDLLAAFAHLGMTSQQEEEILAMAKDRSNRLVDLYDFAGDTQATLADLSAKLQATLEATGSARPLNPS